jgi:hypothetical protein
VIIFHVIDKIMEEEFDLETRPYNLIDMETGETIKLQPAEIQDLRAVYQTIRDGEAKWADYVKPDKTEPQPAGADFTLAGKAE